MRNTLIIGWILLSSLTATAAPLQDFLKHCAYGTLIGAGAGVVTLAFSDKPSDNTGNIAKGASLGLYGGIAYGVYQLNAPPPPVETVVDPYASVMPTFKNGQLDGAQFFMQVVSF